VIALRWTDRDTLLSAADEGPLPSPRFQTGLGSLTRGCRTPQPEETIAIEEAPCYPVAMNDLRDDRHQPQWRPQLLPSRAFLPHELVTSANDIGQIYTDLIGKPARAVRIVIEDDDEATPEMRFELGPASSGQPG
jgi:hypothetical protein